MRSRILFALTVLVAAFAAFTATAGACMLMGYQPELPESLK